MRTVDPIPEAQSAPLGCSRDSRGGTPGGDTLCVGVVGADCVDYSDEDIAELRRQRPRVRGDCESGARPCPWVGCRYHLYLHVTAAGALRIEYPDRDPDEIPETCVLDVAEHDFLTFDDIGRFLGVTSGRIQQIEASALRKMKRKMKEPQ
ncbi:MAG: sigma factor-like helix-turn-helix DNA-binding protein [Pseudomonadota bacterium]